MVLEKALLILDRFRLFQAPAANGNGSETDGPRGFFEDPGQVAWPPPFDHVRCKSVTGRWRGRPPLTTSGVNQV